MYAAISDIAFWFFAVGVPVICFTLITLAKIMRGDDFETKSRRKSSDSNPTKNPGDETRLIQEIHRGLTRLESRIEALETIVIEQDKNKKSTHE